MGTFDNLYLNRIKQLQEENNRLKSLLNEEEGESREEREREAERKRRADILQGDDYDAATDILYQPDVTLHDLYAALDSPHENLARHAFHHPKFIQAIADSPAQGFPYGNYRHEFLRRAAKKHRDIIGWPPTADPEVLQSAVKFHQRMRDRYEGKDDEYPDGHGYGYSPMF